MFEHTTVCCMRRSGVIMKRGVVPVLAAAYLREAGTPEMCSEHAGCYTQPARSGFGLRHVSRIPDALGFVAHAGQVPHTFGVGGRSLALRSFGLRLERHAVQHG